MADPALESAAEQLITDAAYVVHAAAAKELGLGGDHLTDPPAAPDYAAVRALARRRMLAPVELFHDVTRDHADMVRYRGALRAILVGVTVGWLVNGETALVPDELRSELRKVRDEWQRLADRNRAEGWPEQADRVHMPDRMAGQMARLLARTDPRSTRKRTGGTR